MARPPRAPTARGRALLDPRARARCRSPARGGDHPRGSAARERAGRPLGRGQARRAGLCAECRASARYPLPMCSACSAPEVAAGAAPDYPIGRLLAGLPLGRARGARRLTRALHRARRADPQSRPTAAALRASLERALEDASPAAVRARIATWLVTAREATESVPAPPGPRGVWLSNVARRAALAGVGTGVIAALLVGWDRGVQPIPDKPAVPAAAEPAAAPPVPDPPSVDAGAAAAPAPTPEPAHVRFAVFPWGEIRVDGGEAILTPRAEPIALAPGFSPDRDRPSDAGDRAARDQPGGRRADARCATSSTGRPPREARIGGAGAGAARCSRAGPGAPPHRERRHPGQPGDALLRRSVARRSDRGAQRSDPGARSPESSCVCPRHRATRWSAASPGTIWPPATGATQRWARRSRAGGLGKGLGTARGSTLEVPALVHVSPQAGRDAGGLARRFHRASRGRSCSRSSTGEGSQSICMRGGSSGFRLLRSFAP